MGPLGHYMLTGAGPVARPRPSTSAPDSCWGCTSGPAARRAGPATSTSHGLVPGGSPCHASGCSSSCSSVQAARRRPHRRPAEAASRAVAQGRHHLRRPVARPRRGEARRDGVELQRAQDPLQEGQERAQGSRDHQEHDEGAVGLRLGLRHARLPRPRPQGRTSASCTAPTPTDRAAPGPGQTQVVTHELGHVLGLEHYMGGCSLMNTSHTNGVARLPVPLRSRRGQARSLALPAARADRPQAGQAALRRQAEAQRAGVVRRDRADPRHRRRHPGHRPVRQRRPQRHARPRTGGPRLARHLGLRRARLRGPLDSRRLHGRRRATTTTTSASACGAPPRRRGRSTDTSANLPPGPSCLTVWQFDQGYNFAARTDVGDDRRRRVARSRDRVRPAPRPAFRTPAAGLRHLRSEVTGDVAAQ